MGRKVWGAKKHITIRLDPKIIKRLEEISEKANLTFSGALRFLINNGVTAWHKMKVEGDGIDFNKILCYVLQNNINLYNIVWINDVTQDNIRKFTLNVRKDIFEQISRISEENGVPISVLINTALHYFVQASLTDIRLSHKSPECATESYLVPQNNSSGSDGTKKCYLCHDEAATHPATHIPSGKQFAFCSRCIERIKEHDKWRIDDVIS